MLTSSKSHHKGGKIKSKPCLVEFPDRDFPGFSSAVVALPDKINMARHHYYHFHRLRAASSSAEPEEMLWCCFSQLPQNNQTIIIIIIVIVIWDDYKNNRIINWSKESAEVHLIALIKFQQKKESCALSLCRFNNEATSAPWGYLLCPLRLPPWELLLMYGENNRFFISQYSLSSKTIKRTEDGWRLKLLEIRVTLCYFNG